ncbi:MAG: PD-(D/E)XK nuclease family protein [Chlamydia sp.]
MAPYSRLQNLFNWSASRESTFRECKKKYWYTYYGAWDGWPIYYNDPRGKSIDPLAAYLYMLKNMQSLPIFIGSAVHTVIETALKATQGCETKRLPEMSELLLNGENRIKKGIEESTQGAWKKHPKKHTHLLEHYYDFPLESHAIDAAIEKVRKCLENWYTSPCTQNITLSPRAVWKEIEKAMTFEVEKGISAIVVFDFSISWQRKEAEKKPLTVIFDWKTGQENQKIEDQMYAYAIGARRELGIPLESLLLVPFYLAQGPDSYKKIGAHQKDELHEERLIEVQKRIVSSSLEMISLHQVEKDISGASSRPDPTLFPYTTNESSCRKCPFREMCEKADFKQLSIAELRKKIVS